MTESTLTSKLGLEPIPGDSPAGINAKYETEYETLAKQIEKLTSVTDRKVDWDLVCELSETLLGSKTKDLLVASYYTLGLLHRDGYRGLAEGLGILRDMTKTYWETLFPPMKRARARAGALYWLGEKVEPALPELPAPTEGDRETFAAALEAISELDSFCGEKLANDAPSLRPLARAIEGRLAEIPEPEPEPEPEPPPPAPAAEAAPAATPTASAPAPVAAPAPTPPAVSGGNADAVREALSGQMRDFMREGATTIYAADKTDPLSYAIRRRAAWAIWWKLRPPENGQLSFAGGLPDLETKWETMLDQEDFEAVLDEAEPKISEQVWWFTANLYVHRALEGLGKRYQKARLAVEGEVAGWFNEHPEVLELRFSNGNALCNEAMKLWVKSNLSLGGGGGAPVAVSGGGEAAEIGAAMGEAQQMLVKGGFADAVKLISAGLERAGSKRGRFQWELALARICLQAGKPDLALRRLEGLEEDNQRFALEEWEPDLAFDMVELLWRCQLARGDAGEAKQKAKALYDRLCSMDLSAALALSEQ